MKTVSELQLEQDRSHHSIDCLKPIKTITTLKTLKPLKTLLTLLSLLSPLNSEIPQNCQNYQNNQNIIHYPLSTIYYQEFRKILKFETFCLTLY